jgi:orotidine-5'-phosphate decarboxylase
VAELVLALDVPSEPEALVLLDECPGVRWVKVGPVLFTTTGPSLIERLKRRDLRVFLDLKWHDIPNTVRGAVDRARRLGVDLVTVHALGGRGMLETAKAAAGAELAVVGVTVLTSHDVASFGEAVGHPVTMLSAEVERLAALASEAGLDGVVSAPQETAGLRARLGPSALIVNPGIRGSHDARGDQSRVATVTAAAAAGATHLVIGRPVLEAQDRRSAWLGFAEELARCSRPG